MRRTGGIRFLGLWLTGLFLLLGTSACANTHKRESEYPGPLTEPFLQLPTENTIRVVWFTEFLGTEHFVEFGEGLGERAYADTIRLSRVREDRDSHIDRASDEPVFRAIWRHEVLVSGLEPGKRVPYRVTSVDKKGRIVQSGAYTLTPNPLSGTPLKILLTSDHQLKPMTPANLQKVVETVGRVDAVFLAGDLVNVPDRASEWFDDSRGGAFFPSLQGRAGRVLEFDGVKTRYSGGEIIQYAPLFTSVGNHEVMGRFTKSSLAWEFDDPIPRSVAEVVYETEAQSVNPTNDPVIHEQWIRDHSFNTITYEEIFTLPTSPDGGERYYAVTFGDIRLVVLYAARIWRTASMSAGAKSKYREPEEYYDDPWRWGHGSHIFEPVNSGSEQYEWLAREIENTEFLNAKYRIVMLHHPLHSLGANVIPPFTDPVRFIEWGADGSVESVRYGYPVEDDYLIRNIQPLLEGAGVDLVLFGHSHLWNRFEGPTGVHYLETSNVGNSYGAYMGTTKRDNIPDEYTGEFAVTGDPNGLDPVMPTLEPLGTNEAYIASDEITVFSVLETATGAVSSYYFYTRSPDSPVVKFDEFVLE